MVTKKKTTKKTETSKTEINKRIFPTDIIKKVCKTMVEEKIQELQLDSNNLNESGNIKPEAYSVFSHSFIDVIYKHLDETLEKNKYDIFSILAKPRFIKIYNDILKLYKIEIDFDRYVRSGPSFVNTSYHKPYQSKKILIPEDLLKINGSFSNDDYAILEEKLPKINDLKQESVEKKSKLVEELAADAYQEFLKAKRKMVMSRKMVDSFYNKFEKEDFSDDFFVNAENDLREKLISLLKN